MPNFSIPAELSAQLRRMGIDTHDVRALASSDLSLSREYEESWTVVTGVGVVVIRADGSAETVEYGSFDEIKAENLVTTGLLSVKGEDSERMLQRFSNSRLKEYSRLARIAGKIKKGEEITDEDYADAGGEDVCPKCGRRYPDEHRKVCPKCVDRRSIFLRLLAYFPRYRSQIILIMVFMAVQAALQMVGPYLTGRIFYDDVLTPGGRLYGRIALMVGAILGIRALAIVASVTYGRALARVSARVIYTLKTEIFEALQRLSLSFFNRKQTGALMNRVDYDAMQLEYFFIEGLPFFLVNTVIVLGVSAVMLVLNWRLALMVFVPTPLILILTKKLIPRIWSLYSRRYRSSRRLNAIVNDSLTGVRVVKSFGKEDDEVERFGSANLGLYGATVEAMQFSATVFPVVHTVMQIGGFMVWAYGGWRVIQGNISFGVLMSFVGYIAMFYHPMEWFTRLVDWWSHCMNSAQRIFEVLDTHPDIVDRPHPVRLERLKGDIRVRGVTFAYEPNKPVIHEIDLEIEAGQMIGLVGHTGAGKSTITNLITRLYDVDEGEIQIDGVNVRDIAMEDLRAQVGIVLQQTYLFDGTIAQNIAYARPDASVEEIVAAAQSANAHDFITKLPDGYDTMLGRRGQDLSGGERQRVAVARAILKDPRILIFDEATSSVDTETEERIQQAIGRLVSGRTTIAIAHRLSTLRRADKLVVVDKGRIVESGTHAELMRKREKYHELVSREQRALKVIGVVE